jgi:hypothetical protein
MDAIFTGVDAIKDEQDMIRVYNDNRVS